MRTLSQGIKKRVGTGVAVPSPDLPNDRRTNCRPSPELCTGWTYPRSFA